MEIPIKVKLFVGLANTTPSINRLGYQVAIQESITFNLLGHFKLQGAKTSALNGVRIVDTHFFQKGSQYFNTTLLLGFNIGNCDGKMFGFRKLIRREIRRAVREIVQAPKTMRKKVQVTKQVVVRSATTQSIQTETIKQKVIFGRCHVALSE